MRRLGWYYREIMELIEWQLEDSKPTHGWD